jgi:hypothetical protein
MKPDFMGQWAIAEAQTLDGKRYQGSVRISPLRDAYALDWQTTVGNYAGIGLARGGVLYAAWCLAPNYGIILYDLLPDGSIRGEWVANRHDGRVGEEVGHLTDHSGQRNTFALRGTNPDGSRYTGVIQMQQLGETLSVMWQIGSVAYTGVGLKAGHLIAVAWSKSPNVGIVEYAFDGDKANGIWTVPGSARLTFENLQRQQA